MWVENDHIEIVHTHVQYLARILRLCFCQFQSQYFLQFINLLFTCGFICQNSFLLLMIYGGSSLSNSSSSESMQRLVSVKMGTSKCTSFISVFSFNISFVSYMEFVNLYLSLSSNGIALLYNSTKIKLYSPSSCTYNNIVLTHLHLLLPASPVCIFWSLLDLTLNNLSPYGLAFYNYT